MRRMIQRRVLQGMIGLLAGVIVTVCLAGCRQPAADGPTRLEVWQAFKPEEAEVFHAMMREVEADWRAQGRDVEIIVHYVAYDDMITKLRTAAMAHLTPDVAFVDAIKVTDLAFGRALAPLDRLEVFVERYGSIKAARRAFVGASFDAGVVNRQGEVSLYGLPVQTTTVTLFWNRAMFRQQADRLRQAGLDPLQPPRDLDELLAYAEALTDRESGVFGFGLQGGLWFNFPFFHMYGVEFIEYDEEGHAAAALDNANMRAALERLRTIATSPAEGGAWKRSGLFPEAGFINQKYAMIMTGPWMVENFTNAGLDFDTALIPGPTRAEIDRLGLPPKAPGRVDELGTLAWSSSNVGGQTGVILRRSEHPELAFELLDRFTGEAMQRRWASTLGQIPVRLAAWPDLDTSKYPFLPRFMEQLSMAERIPQFPLFGRLETDLFNPEFNLLLQDPRYPVDAMIENLNANVEERILARINRVEGE